MLWQLFFNDLTKRQKLFIKIYPVLLLVSDTGLDYLIQHILEFDTEGLAIQGPG